MKNENEIEIWIQETKNVFFEIDSENIVVNSTIKKGEWVKLDLVDLSLTEEYKSPSDVTRYWEQTLNFSLSETVKNRNIIFSIQEKKLTAICKSSTGIFILIGWENPLEIFIKENQDAYTFTYIAPQTKLAPTFSNEVIEFLSLNK